MTAAWWATLFTALAVLFIPLFHPLVLVVGLGLVAFNLTLMLACLYRAARVGGPPGYAFRQLLLALLLMPIALLGFFLVPWLVRSDLRKWAEPAHATAD